MLIVGFKTNRKTGQVFNDSKKRSDKHHGNVKPDTGIRFKRESPRFIELDNISNIYDREGLEGRIGEHFAHGGSYDDFINKGYFNSMSWDEYKKRFNLRNDLHIGSNIGKSSHEMQQIFMKNYLKNKEAFDKYYKEHPDEMPDFLKKSRMDNQIGMHHNDFDTDSHGKKIPDAPLYVVMTDNYRNATNGKIKRIIVPVKNNEEAKKVQERLEREHPDFFSIARSNNIPRDKHYMNKDRFNIVIE